MWNERPGASLAPSHNQILLDSPGIFFEWFALPVKPEHENIAVPGQQFSDMTLLIFEKANVFRAENG